MNHPDTVCHDKTVVAQDDTSIPATAESLSKLTYEEALAALEDVVAKLESGEVTLDESMQLFQQGTALARICTAQLAAIEKQITQLLQKEDGSVEEKSFAEES